MGMRAVVGASAILLATMLAGWSCGAAGYSHLDRAFQESALRGDLREAHTSLLGARVDLYDYNFASAGLRLDNARDLLRRAAGRAERLGWADGVKRIDLTAFEADLDEAQQLLGRLNGESPFPVGQGLGVFEGQSRTN